MNSSKVLKNGVPPVYLKNLRYTEIWSNDGESKSIKLADPQLDDYFHYPELFLVDIDYCVKS